MQENIINVQELWKKQKSFLIALGILLLLTGLYDIFWRSKIESGLIGLIIAFLAPVAIYRRYFTGVILLMLGSLLVLNYPLLGIPIFTLGIAYISIKEAMK